MGLLKLGQSKPWSNSKPDLRYVRESGVDQFLHTYKRVKDLTGDELFFGDEVEYGIFHLGGGISGEAGGLKMSLRGKAIMDELNSLESTHSIRNEGCSWVPEYGAWMIESTPSRPYNAYVDDLLRVERSMRLRRSRLLVVLQDEEIAPTVSTYPLMGAAHVAQQSYPSTQVGGAFAESSYVSDGIINPHPRFGTLTQNIRSRRGCKVDIRVPLFRDTKTPEYDGVAPPACCEITGLPTGQSVWSYGKPHLVPDHLGNKFVMTGCSNDLDWLSRGRVREGAPATLRKYRVQVDDPAREIDGLYYRSMPGVIIADKDWPRCGSVVVGAEVSDNAGWVRLQNGYYLPTASEDGKIRYLHKITDTSVDSTNDGLNRMGSPSPRLVAKNPPKLPPLAPLDSFNEDAKVAEDPNLAPPPHPFLTATPAIHMDAMAFGMGCCCLQITFQAEDMDESRFMYDQLAVLAPIMMALTASTPILKGRLADTDARWGIIAESVDDRTEAELTGKGGTEDEFMAGKGVRRLFKSRYDSISTYIYQGACSPNTPCGLLGSPFQNRILNKYNDIPVVIDENHYLKLRSEGVDPALAQHVAHLFIRDPLVVFEGRVEEVDDEKETEHFESIQSTNWQSCRWKPPPPRLTTNDPHIGWRTEFRSMEIQMTDFENAAFTTFILLTTRAMLAFDLNLYLPLSRVDANMQRAHSREASRSGKFFFRRHLAPLEEGDEGYGEDFEPVHSGKGSPPPPTPTPCDGGEARSDSPGVSTASERRRLPCANGGAEENSFEEMTMNEIMNGKGSYFAGLIPIVYAYLDLVMVSGATMARLDQYLNFIKKRSNGELVTPATWQRNFVRNHPAYAHDSVVTEVIARDLMIACNDIGLGKRHESSLLGDVRIEEITTTMAYEEKLKSRFNGGGKASRELLQRYVRRATEKTEEGESNK